MSQGEPGGRVAVVTGATGGIGREIAAGLARAGLQVVLVGRDPDRLEQARRSIAAEASSAPWIVLADLSLLGETRRAADAIAALTGRVDVLVNNAGLLSPSRSETAEGHELTLAVNHLSPFVLTRRLLPLLRAAPAGARVVDTGSSYSEWCGIDPDDLELHRGWRMVRAYARSKLALLMAGIDLAERERGANVTVNVAHPGLVATGLVRNGGIDQFVWKHVLQHVALTPKQGAATTLHAALSPSFTGISGCYLKRLAPASPNRRARDAALRARVVARTQELVGAA